MITPYDLPGKEKCWTTGWKFVHTRLITIMEDFINDWVGLQSDEEYNRLIRDRKKYVGSKSGKGELVTLVDFDALGKNKDFVDSIMLNFVPRAIQSREYAVYEFFNVYYLLTAKEEFEPDLMSQNILQKVIRYGIEESDDGFRKRIVRIPTKNRNLMIKEIEEDLAEYGWSKEDPPLNEMAKEEVKRFEDLAEYPELLCDCFGDDDSSLLDLFSSEEELAKSPIAKEFGINTNMYSKTMEKYGLKVEAKYAPYAKDIHVSFSKEE